MVAAAPTIVVPRPSEVGAEPEPTIVAPLAPGDMIGRYVVQARIGAGGMGEVYRALDPGLDRMVAIKLVHGRAAADEDRQRALVDEAQALARLSHPNVVQVYDAGTHEGRVFVAMELVLGRTLQHWLHRGDEAPDWRDIIDVFLDAGRGLMAAHAAGIVHGDFKPTNVMIGSDGRARVFDFGLARPVVDASTLATDRSLESGPAGAIVRGTPAFMAPEQMTGDPLTPATDQFAFCVALHHALWRTAPFAGSTLDELQRNVQSGAFHIVDDRRLPAGLKQIVARGLAVDPAARHPSMATLLAALTRLRGRRRRLLYGAAIALSAGGVAAALVWSQPARCDTGVQRSAAIWTTPRREAVTAGLTNAGRAWAEEAARRVDATVDAYVTQWNATHREACETGRKGDDATLDATMACLGDALFELDATLTLLANADESVAKKAAGVADALPDPRRCIDAARPGISGHDANDDAGLREQLAAARAANRGGRYKEAIAISRRMLDDPRLGVESQLHVDAMLVFADAHDFDGQREQALQLYREAIAMAASARYEYGEAKGWITLVRVAGATANFDEADGAIRQAELWISRLGDDVELQRDLGLNAGTMLVARGMYAEACARLEAALAITAGVAGAGERHAAILNNLGVAYGLSGQHERARDYFSRAAAVKSELHGPGHPDVATSLLNAGVSLHQLGEDEQARAVFEEVTAIRTAAFGPDHPEVAAAGNSLATAMSALGRHEEALALYQRALEIRTVALGADHQSNAITRNNVAHELMKLGRPADALPYVEEALAHLQRRLGASHPTVAYAFHTLGEVRLALGEPAAAIAALESALAIREAQTVDPRDLGHTRFVLARAIRIGKGDGVRARALAQQAREVLGAQGHSGVTQADIDRWLAGEN
jgi:tetratricopeptide (TPR) repeat protein/predicted Ser/Thr protein kinase